MEWYELYNLLAKELSKFYKDFNEKDSETSVEFAGEDFFNKCKKRSDFYVLFNWAKNISENSIDPFHIFVSFNNNNTTLERKQKRMQFYFDILGYEIDVEKYLRDNRFSVPHIPVLQLLTNRPKNIQDDIWKFFIGIINNNEYEIRQGFENYNKWYGIGFIVITEMLFWIDSSKYISLDKNTSKVLIKNSTVTKIPNDYDSYLNLISRKTKLELDDNIFRILIKYAYDKELPNNDYEKTNLNKFLTNNTTAMNSIQKNEKDIEPEDIQFQLIAVNILENKSKKYIKSLKKNTLYQFNKKFEFKEQNILYYKNYNINLYKLNNHIINICSIVGENGSGKSTLLELAFMIINNITKKIFERQNQKNEDIQVKYIGEINAELYFITDNLYKISINNEKVIVNKFKQIYSSNEIIKFGEPYDCTDRFNFDNLYYTNHINYSLHSLNQNYFGDWIYNLFHKNDGYETPIVLEPYRKKGNIDINLLQSLMKQRLLSYILDYSNESFRQITKKSKATKIELTVDYFKFTSIASSIPEEKDLKVLIEKISLVFDFSEERKTKILTNFTCKDLKIIDFDINLHIDEMDESLLKTYFKNVSIEFFYIIYIYNKLNSIVNKYEDFKNLKQYKKENKLEELLQEIKKNTCHTTFKIRQAIYNLKYLEELNYKKETKTFTIDTLSNVITNEILSKESSKDSYLKFDDLIPSSIFKVDIILENNEYFDSLSSGEKQKIFVINSIMYHLKNIASKNDGYRNVNIVLDEIELYFHPEMQKDFIDDLLFMLENNDYIYNLSALNFMFITHSPFVLSDLIDINLLMLDKESNPIEKNKKTFAANIYDLLHDSFFLNGFIGKYAEKKIQQIIHIIQLYKILKNKDDNSSEIDYLIESYNTFFKQEAIKEDINEILSFIENSKHILYDIVNSIGEPVLRNKLIDELNTIFENTDENNLKEIITKLKDKGYEDIKKELSQYSNKTKEKILAQLFGNQND